MSFQVLEAILAAITDKFERRLESILMRYANFNPYIVFWVQFWLNCLERCFFIIVIVIIIIIISIIIIIISSYHSLSLLLFLLLPLSF